MVTMAVMPMASTTIGTRFFSRAGGMVGWAPGRQRAKADFMVVITWGNFRCEAGRGSGRGACGYDLQRQLDQFVDGAHDFVAYLHQHGEGKAGFLACHHGADQVVALAAIDITHFLRCQTVIVVDLVDGVFHALRKGEARWLSCAEGGCRRDTVAECARIIA